MASILDYKPAQLHEQKDNWEVVYYSKNPLTDKLQRIRIKVNHIKSKKDRRDFVNKLIVEINKKLANGWNPFVEQEAKMTFTKIKDAFEKFINIKTRELRESTIKAYIRDINQLYNFLETRYSLDNMYIFSLDKNIALAFLNYKYINDAITERTYNNYLNDFSSIWNWFLEYNYVKANIWQGLKRKKQKEKIRKLIDIETLTNIFAYTKENEPSFYAIILLCYYGLIRPNEIIQLKGIYLDFLNNLIFIPSRISKPGIQRYVTMNMAIKQSLLDIQADKLKSQYVFSNNFQPGIIRLSSEAITSKWARLRDKLNFSKEYQFYSLKDTGIVYLLNKGVPPNIVRDQAGHTNIATTNKYIQRYIHNSTEELKYFE